MTGAREERALFASASGALRFALNFEDLSIPGPVMNREMATTTLERAKAEAQARAYTGSDRRSNTAPRKHVPLGGKDDRAVMAGWVLQRFMHLDVVHRLVLTLTELKPRQPCSCGSPCCRGWTLRREWLEAARILTEHIQDWAVLDKESGKRGYSTDPKLRVALVEDFARPIERRLSLADLAERTGVTTKTVAAHRVKIHGYLQEQLDAAWDELGVVFDAHGITGQLLD